MRRADIGNQVNNSNRVTGLNKWEILKKPGALSFKCRAGRSWRRRSLPVMCCVKIPQNANKIQNRPRMAKNAKNDTFLHLIATTENR
jgi:hypothetical protein